MESIDALQLFSRGIPDNFDYQSLAEFVVAQPRNFVKWNTRPGYAVVCNDGFLRWHGFELSGVRHGAEDLAWFIGDETWPLNPQQMIEVVSDTFDSDCGNTLDDYLEYLSVYTTLHCVQRLKSILREVQNNGWRDLQNARRKDQPGVDPNFALQLCKVGAFFADRSKLTKQVVANFEQSVDVIATIAATSGDRA